MKKYAKHLKRAKELGAKEAKIISAKSVVTAGWVRLKCQFGCDGYGKALTCPPNSPTPEQTRKVLQDYKHVLLIHGEEHSDIRGIVSVLEKEIFLDGFYKAFAMAAGPCDLCAECSEYCRHTEKARPSMEACGIDVYETVRANGYPLKVVNTEDEAGNYYGIVLIE